MYVRFQGCITYYYLIQVRMMSFKSNERSSKLRIYPMSDAVPFAEWSRQNRLIASTLTQQQPPLPCLYSPISSSHSFLFFHCLPLLLPSTLLSLYVLVFNLSLFIRSILPNHLTVSTSTPSTNLFIWSSIPHVTPQPFLISIPLTARGVDERQQ